MGGGGAGGKGAASCISARPRGGFGAEGCGPAVAADLPAAGLRAAGAWTEVPASLRGGGVTGLAAATGLGGAGLAAAVVATGLGVAGLAFAGAAAFVTGLVAGAAEAGFLAGVTGFLAATFTAALDTGFALPFPVGSFAAGGLATRALAAGLGEDFAGAAALRRGATTFFAWAAGRRPDLPAPPPAAGLLPDALARAGAFIPDDSPAALARDGRVPTFPSNAARHSIGAGLARFAPCATGRHMVRRSTARQRGIGHLRTKPPQTQEDACHAILLKR